MKNKLASLIYPLTLLVHQAVYAEESQMLDMIVVSGAEENKAEAGKDKMFSENQVTLYKSKQEIEAYRGHSVADLLTGTTGVYSGDARNSGALDPNIRGVQGQGRIPVLVDGTEQAITVWRGYAGVSNRNYLDPFLISSVTVEKGANLSRTLDNGAAGTIRLGTLEPDDIIKPGEKFGVELKMETANNSIKKRGYPIPIGVDYRGLEHPEDVELAEWSALFKTSDRYPAHSKGRNKFFKDNAYRLAIASKDDHFEGLVAYAYRSKGNYYSGRKGGHNYGEGQTLESYSNQHNINPDYYSSDDPYIPWIAIVYHPGKEVPNTSFESESYLGKATFKFNNSTKLNFGIRHTDMNYGEIMPSRLWQTSYQQGTVLQWPLARVKQTAANASFEYNPPDNQWINLNMGIYGVWNKAKTNTSGGSPADILFWDSNFKALKPDIPLPNVVYPGEAGYAEFLKAKDAYFQALQQKWKEYYNANDKLPNQYGIFNTREAQAQWSKDKHFGFNVSNRFEINKRLNLDLMTSYKYETLNSTNVFMQEESTIKKVCGGYGSSLPGVPIYCQSNDLWMSGDRIGKRKEFNFGFNVQYSPFDWLILDAGAKYTHYKSRDDGLRKRIEGKERTEFASSYPAVIRFDYETLPEITDKVLDIYKRYKLIKDYQNTYSELYPEPFDVDEWFDWTNNQDEYVHQQFKNAGLSYPTDEEIKIANSLIKSGEMKSIYWERDEYGNFDASSSPINTFFTEEKLNEEQYNPATGKMEKTIKMATANFDGLERRNPTPAEWEKMKKAERTDHAWAPAFGATVLLTNNIRLYARYIETKRMPSIFEDTIGYSVVDLHPFYKRKPEHSKSFEIGYVQDLRGLIPSARRADIRLNYFHNLTKNIFDRDVNYEMKQFDKRVLEGLEFQARYDQGNIFADLGVVYNLKNKFCDKSSAILDRGGWRYNSYQSQKMSRFYPECVNGGNANGYLKNTIAPKYSITANLGFRALNEHLEIGTRWLYHSKVKETRNKSLREAGFWGSGETNRWNPVLVVDAYINYLVNENLKLELSGTNLTDRYYLDPLTRSSMPAPGRTIKFGLTAKF